ncbi:MAG: hypothetical protein Q8N23_28340 [Archangium sp.]|nr:hypothetical protein [Archangium sp.]MDP3156614.1 hypothetical protein [Archangium sp.]MDP3576189.1 hypothetical protein [Archangium sp.]
MSADAFLQEWTRITTELTQVVETALDVEPPGECPEAWARWLTRFEVPRLDEERRSEEVREAKQTKGAPLREVQGCLESLAREASARLAPLRKTLSAEQAALVERSLHTFASTAFEHYKTKATEKKKKMFGAAKALANQHQYGGFGASTGYVLTCVTCRAPRLGESLTCAFCGGELAGVS